MTVTITPATHDEAAPLVAIQVAAFHSDAELYPDVGVGGPPGYDSVDAMRKDIAKDDVYTIRYDGHMVGGMKVIRQGEGKYWLGVLFVDPAYHSRGIGTAAMHFIEERYPDAIRWRLDTPQWATRNHYFYEKLDYKRVGTAIIGGTPLYVYEKRLDDA
jgi:GNAT superfamily N-acetyltransferase